MTAVSNLWAELALELFDLDLKLRHTKYDGLNRISSNHRARPDLFATYNLNDALPG
jgi:hypothetical protein